jgi:hypothetical protein
MATTGVSSSTKSPTGNSLSNAEKKIMDLKTTDQEVFRLVRQAFEGGSEATKQAVSYAIQQRGNTSSLWSAILKSMSDSTRAVIQNLGR